MLGVIIILIIVAIKGIFSAAETAYAHLSYYKIHQMSKKDKKAKRVYKMLENNHRFFGLAEVGIIVCEILASAVAAEFYVNSLSSNLMNLNITNEASKVISVLIVTLVLSYFLLVFGALIPKRIAKVNPHKTMYRLINILYILSFINYPFEKIATFSTNIFCKIFRIKETAKEQLTEKEIKMVITEGKEQGIISKFEKELLINALKYNSIIVKDLMIPKDKVNFINIKSNVNAILQNIKKYSYTRMPVYDGTKDTIVGIFNIKDIIVEYSNSKEVNIDINKFLRPVMFVENNERIADAFKLMQANKQPMLVVVNETRKVVGIITMEDIIEVLMGKILDEYDK